MKVLKGDKKNTNWGNRMKKRKLLTGKLLEEHLDVSSAGYYPDVRRVMLKVKGREVWIDDVDLLAGEGDMQVDKEAAAVFFKKKEVCKVVEVKPFPKRKEKVVICYPELGV